MRKMAGLLAAYTSVAAMAAFMTACAGQGHADGTLVGHLYAVGGPAPGSPRPLPGIVTVTGSGVKVDVPIGTSGSFSVSIPAGRYKVVGHSPLYGGGQYLCQAELMVKVNSAHATEANVWCQEK